MIRNVLKIERELLVLIGNKRGENGMKRKSLIDFD